VHGTDVIIYIVFGGKILRKKDNLEDLGGGGVMLTWVLKKCDKKM